MVTVLGTPYAILTQNSNRHILKWATTDYLFSNTLQLTVQKAFHFIQHFVLQYGLHLQLAQYN
jgi:hypothetical protein